MGCFNNTPYYHALSNLCYDSCPAFTVLVPTNASCYPYDCLTFDNNFKCLTCKPTDNRVLNPQTSRCIPKIGYYENLTSVCPQCPTGCSLCSSSTNCQACLSGYYFYIDQLCYNNCPARYYNDDSSQTCKICSYDCYTCNPNGNCLTCNLTTDFRVLDVGTNRCVAKDGYFDSLTQISTQCPP